MIGWEVRITNLPQGGSAYGRSPVACPGLRSAGGLVRLGGGVVLSIGGLVRLGGGGVLSIGGPVRVGGRVSGGRVTVPGSPRVVPPAGGRVRSSSVRSRAGVRVVSPRC